MKNNHKHFLLIAAAILAPLLAAAQTINYFEGFDDDFIIGQDVPNLVDASLSTSFSDINDFGAGQLTLRDRNAGNGGNGGGFAPLNDVVVDFSFGGGSFITFNFPAGAGYFVGQGSTITFDVVTYGDDPGTLTKYVSSDGVNFTQVGNNSAINGPYAFNLATGGGNTWFRLQIGNASIFDGVWVDHFSATLNIYQDDDCDGVANADDLCPGGDDAVDNNNDGLPDCKFYPGFGNLIGDWKCGNNNQKFLVCHNGETKCLGQGAFADHLAHGDIIGPCGGATCIQPLVGFGNGDVLVLEASQQAGLVHLYWVNNTGFKNDRFVLEKSADGVGFVPMGEMGSLAADSEAKLYRANDDQPGEGDNFYRIRLLLQDGSHVFSNVRQVAFPFDPEKIYLFPNPASGAAWLYLEKFAGKKGSVRVFDSLGRLMSTQAFDEIPSEPVALDLHGLEDGLYLVTVEAEGFRLQVRRLAVVR